MSEEVGDVSRIFGDYGMQGTHLHDRVLAEFAPLLAKLQAVEALADELDGEWREDFANRIRRALDAS